MKKNNKGFTLVELIVVLVILAILAAILVPALLGWIDKAREKSVTTNAEAAYVAAQGLATEYYGTHTKASELTKSKVKSYITPNKIKFLTDIEENYTISVTTGSTGKDVAKVKKFEYNNGIYTAKWESAAHDGVGAGEWVVTKNASPSTPATVNPDKNTKTNEVDN